MELSAPNNNSVVSETAGIGVRIDGQVDAAYATFSTRPVARTVELESGLIVDLATDGTLVGIEVLGYSRPFNPPAPTH